MEDHAWEERIVVELDSALNKWADGVPAHLHWDPHREDPVFFNQSVALYCAYYHVQMITHRPFIPMVREMPTTLPSLAVCTNAARSCICIADVWHQRMGNSRPVIILHALTIAGIILLLNVWSGKRTGLAPHMNTTIEEVHKCMQVIRVLESRWQVAGMFWDILNELATVGQVPLPTSGASLTPTMNQRKRSHSVYDDSEHHDIEAHLTPTHTMEASVAPVVADLEAPEAFAWVGALDALQLPTYGVELGRLPVFPAPRPPDGDCMSYPLVPEQGLTYAGPASATGVQHYHSSGGGAGTGSRGALGLSAEDALRIIDNDAMVMWTNAPMNLGADDWGTYFGLMNELNEEQPPPRLACGSIGR